MKYYIENGYHLSLNWMWQMKFNQLISEKLHSLFIEHGLKIMEQSNSIVKYESQELVISLSHDPKENSNNLWMGRKNYNKVAIDNQVMQEHFKSDLNLGNLSLEAFVNNVFLFFIGEGEVLLNGNEPALVNLEKFDEQRCFDHTAKLLEQQNLEAAYKAWIDGNFSDVIKYLEKVNKANLSASFKQKYKIAQQKLNSEDV